MFEHFKPYPSISNSGQNQEIVRGWNPLFRSQFFVQWMLLQSGAKENFCCTRASLPQCLVTSMGGGQRLSVRSAYAKLETLNGSSDLMTSKLKFIEGDVWQVQRFIIYRYLSISKCTKRHDGDQSSWWLLQCLGTLYTFTAMLRVIPCCECSVWYHAVNDPDPCEQGKMAVRRDTVDRLRHRWHQITSEMRCSQEFGLGSQIYIACMCLLWPLSFVNTACRSTRERRQHGTTWHRIDPRVLSKSICCNMVRWHPVDMNARFQQWHPKQIIPKHSQSIKWRK